MANIKVIPIAIVVMISLLCAIPVIADSPQEGDKDKIRPVGPPASLFGKMVKQTDEGLIYQAPDGKETLVRFPPPLDLEALKAQEELIGAGWERPSVLPIGGPQPPFKKPPDPSLDLPSSKSGAGEKSRTPGTIEYKWGPVMWDNYGTTGAAQWGSFRENLYLGSNAVNGTILYSPCFLLPDDAALETSSVYYQYSGYTYHGFGLWDYTTSTWSLFRWWESEPLFFSKYSGINPADGSRYIGVWMVRFGNGGTFPYLYNWQTQQWEWIDDPYTTADDGNPWYYAVYNPYPNNPYSYGWDNWQLDHSGSMPVAHSSSTSVDLQVYQNGQQWAYNTLATGGHSAWALQPEYAGGWEDAQDNNTEFYTWWITAQEDDYDETYPEFGGGVLGSPLEWTYNVLSGADSSWIASYMNDGQAVDWEKHYKRNQDPFQYPYADRGWDSLYVDGVDLVWAGHHGNPGKIQFFNTQHDDNILDNDFEVPTDQNNEAQWGDGDMEWIMLESCLTLKDDPHDGIVQGQYVKTNGRFANALDGVHLICGMVTSLQTSLQNGTEVANRLVDSDGPGPDEAKTVKDAWFDGLRETQPAGRIARVIGENIACGNDYIWGQGPVTPDPQVDGYYYVWTRQYE